MTTSDLASDLGKLVHELTSIRKAWSAIVIRYTYGAISVDDLDDDEVFQNVTCLNLTLLNQAPLGLSCLSWLKPARTGSSQSAALSFNLAYVEARYQAVDVMYDRFAALANRIVQFFGADKFDLERSGPPLPGSRCDVFRSTVLAHLLTGTHDCVEAGKRILLWAAISAEPATYFREEGHRELYKDWVRDLVIFSNDDDQDENSGGVCRVLPWPMDWVSAAFDSLSRDSNGIGPGRIDVTGDKALTSDGQDIASTHPEKHSFEHSNELGEGSEVEALRQLLAVFTDGVANERFNTAASVLQNDTLTVNAKLTKIDAILPFPATVSSQQLGTMIGCSKQAVLKTEWWAQHRKGERETEIGRRREKHFERAKQHESYKMNDQDD